jgi:hypothetical protein
MSDYSVDHWDKNVDGELSEINLGNKLRNKYGHRFYQYVLPSGWSIGNHTHEETKADAILAGAMKITIIDQVSHEEKSFVLEKGDILYLKAGTLHRAQVLPGQDCIFYDSYK